ncbi:hypothetical protein KIN20_009617 [Parelaphostrongylus tenuis]|uniref:Uncharacterized protein n=1 Tax=Parelaphostrongylus tenuis TaxID=148309 RepID=A0AAD5MY03_PARTN|nr:hypothetical protein KIN20_009617 [Parelaphostrongylus tenuis]
MTKKRTTDSKSLMSEFKGGDLNKYTAKTYAIQNGNEVFGGEWVLICITEQLLTLFVTMAFKLRFTCTCIYLLTAVEHHHSQRRFL